MAATVRTRLTLLMTVSALSGVTAHAALTQWPLPQALGWLRDLLGLGAGFAAPAWGSGWALAWTAVVALVFCAWSARLALAPLTRVLRALEGGVLSYRDGDFSLSLRPSGHGELGELVRLHNELGQALREQRQHLVQRELLLDTVVQNTPVALVLIDARGYVVYANIAARHLLGEGRSLQGLEFEGLLAGASPALREALAAGEDVLCSMTMDGSEETFHISQRGFRLQGQPHRLHLLKRMTRELSRQEVASWKRLIRVISHELNNSLAPISSLAHSCAELVRRGDTARATDVLESIGERTRRLHGFLDGFAQFAKLPSPRIQAVNWDTFIAGLQAHSIFQLEAPAPPGVAHFDAGQMEQALINLLKNAQESGSREEDVTLSCAMSHRELVLVVSDRGPGMSEAVLAQALLPFYSTKRAGTGLGLALAREIVEAHGGRIALVNRSGGGLRVTLTVPQ